MRDYRRIFYPDAAINLTANASADGGHVHAVANFLAEYASWMLGCGATCIRIVKNTRRMAQAFGVGFDILIMPAHVYVSTWNEEGTEDYVAARKVAATGISFNLNAVLSRFSWEVADNHINLNDATSRLKELCAMPRTPKLEVLILASCANAAFCRLFGGDAMAMLVVLIATLCGFALKQFMLARKRDQRLTVIASSFVSAMIGACAGVLHFGSTPDIALATSVLYQIPGVPYINCISDLIDRHYLTAMWRFTDAAITTVCITIGLLAGMALLGINWF